MNKQDVKNELYGIAKLYPTLLGMMQKKLQNGTTVGDHWAAMICSQCNSQTYFEDVCETYASGQRDLPQPTDQLCREIIKEVRHKQWEDQMRMESYAVQAAGRRTEANKFVEDDPVGMIAARYCFGKVKAGQQTEEDNASRMDAIMEWAFRCGPKPDFMEGEE